MHRFRLRYNVYGPYEGEMGDGDAVTVSGMSAIFTISAAFHCALILVVMQMHGSAGGKCPPGETVIEVGLVGLADLAQTAAAPCDTTPKNQDHFLGRKSLPIFQSGAPFADGKRTPDAKKKNRAAPIMAAHAGYGGETDWPRSTAPASIPTEEATVDSAGNGDGGAGLSPTAVNSGMDTPPDSHGDDARKSNAPDSAPDPAMNSAASRGSGGEAAKRGYLVENFLYIKNRITRHLSYPPVARRLKWQGIAVVTFYIMENGLVENIKISSSSGHQLLDNHVIDTVKRLQPFPKPPVKAEITIPVKYVLRGS